MGGIEHLLERNHQWAGRMKKQDPDFLPGLSLAQKPEILWIGCADSRVCANQIMDLPPGAVFVHRNIANIVSVSDLNCLSVLHYAVETLGVRHVIVCGHYGCGGVQAALTGEDHGLVDHWLNHIRAVRQHHAAQFTDKSREEQIPLLCELNVREQVSHVCDTSIVSRAWKNGQDLTIHGLIYDMGSGILEPLCVRTAPAEAQDPA